MSDNQSVENDIVFPSIIFKVNDHLYCVDSHDVLSLLQLPEYEPVPNAPMGVTGMFSYLGQVYQLCDLRYAFGLASLNDDLQAFTQMIKERKQDHIHWVNELERTIIADEPFSLATDPHQCAFGRWYDNFQSDSPAVQFVLKKIDEPHRKLHQAALEVAKCKQECEQCQREVCLKEILQQAKETYMPMVLSLLDEACEIIKSSLYREMVLVVNSDQRRIGIIVDEILGIAQLDIIESDYSTVARGTDSLFTCARTHEKYDQIILEIDLIKALNCFYS